MNWSQAFYLIKDSLIEAYGSSEAAAIAHLLLEHISKMRKLERLMHKEQLLSEAQEAAVHRGLEELFRRIPIQYLIGEAWFLERRFSVNPSVLIPRPETEELVLWIVRDYSGKAPSILDIGTGSGCIPISLKLELPDAYVSACDISAAALATAALNARALGADIHLMEMDILDASQWGDLPLCDCIVSNPPYIPLSESDSLEPHVRENEPHLALFVHSDDPLLFYRKIGEMALQRLNSGGHLYFETHKDYMESCCSLLASLGYQSITPQKDMHDNWRMIRALRP